MRVLVCGGREYDNHDKMLAVLSPLGPGTIVIHGGARGADRLAGSVARVLGYEVEVYPADWRNHGRSAGPIRNNRMLRDGKPDLVIAFTGGTGTLDMVSRARRAGVPVQFET